jgi:alpha-glucoside transport system permease protein
MGSGSVRRNRIIGLLLVNGILLLMVLLWTVPTFGVLVSSFRTRLDIQTSGWWTIFPHQDWETVAVINPRDEGLDPEGVMAVQGVEATFEEMREGVENEDGTVRVIWVGNRRIGTIQVQELNWTVNWDFTLEN